MSIPILRTKLYISPLRPEVVSRPHLLERLHAGRVRQLTLISAPAGFGKTTLLREWVDATVLPVAWLSLDAGDNDPTRFWIYIIAALQTIKEDLGKAVLEELQTLQSPPPDSLIIELINNINDLLDFPNKKSGFVKKTTLILDDFHVIKERRIHDALTFFLENLPRQLHIIISGRADPPWPMARFRARRQMIEIRTDDLRFTTDEVAAFLTDVMGLEISPEDVAALDQRTEGWIAGLQMAAISMQGRDDISRFVSAFSGSHRFILDYLVEEVLGKQPVEVQLFLLQTSILEQMNASLCDALTGRSDSQEMLRQLEDDNLFLISLDDQRHWYRYHHLFSELLRNQLSVDHPDETPTLHQKASQWFEQQGFTDESIHHAFAARDYERIARLIEKYAMKMLQQSKHSLLSTWIEALPEETIGKRPWLCVYQSWTRHWAGIRDGGDECLENAERLLNSTPTLSEEDKQILPGYIATVRAHYALIKGEIARVVEQAQVALLLLPEDDYYTRGTAAIALGGAYWGKGDLLSAERAFAECASAALKGGYHPRASSALCYQGMMQVRQGKLTGAEAAYREALTLAQDSVGRRYPIAGYALAKLAELACEWNDLEQAFTDAREGVNLCLQLGHVDLVAEAYAALAQVQLALKDYVGVESTLRQTDQLSRRTTLDPWAICWMEDCRVRLWLATDHLAEALDWARTNQRGADSELSFHADLDHIQLAMVWVAQLIQQSDGADRIKTLSLLDRLLAAVGKAGWVHHQIRVLILKALTHQTCGDVDLALNTLAQALALAEPSVYLRVFINGGDPVRELLALMLERKKTGLPTDQGVSAGYLNKLLEEFAIGGEGQWAGMVDQSTLCEPLTPREIEILRYLTTNLTVPEIAEELVLSANTVRSHVKQIYGKLEVNRRLSAVQKARQLHLV